MEVARNQVFNLWDTNGRRHDVVNAIEIYLRILQDLFRQYPKESWNSYPDSTLQYLFYEAALKASPEVFQSHQHFDDFKKSVIKKYDKFLAKTLKLDEHQKAALDTNVEQRARHYTSNLVKLGFADKYRTISEAGKNLLNGIIVRDKLEALLPITDTNLVILRQLLKLKIYTSPDPEGNRRFYSPCLFALYMLLYNETIGINHFKQQIQGISPYWDIFSDSKQLNNIDIITNLEKEISIPQEFDTDSKISYEVFQKHIKNRKSSTIVTKYYEFYSMLFDYVQMPDDNNFIVLRDILLGDDNSKFEKAFGFGNAIFQCGNKLHPYTHEKFKEQNSKTALLTKNVNREFYKRYYVSKYIDTAKEYSDTTIRMLGATGLFQFSKPLVELSHKEFLKIVMSNYDFGENIFGTVSQEEYESAENGILSDFYKETTLTEILKFTNEDINTILSDLRQHYGDSKDILAILVEENRVNLEKHIKEKYPKEKVVELLRLFSNRGNDKTIKQYVNEDATVPTIYEFIVAIAWYYISNKEISVYDSLNLTLNGDFEPVVHAGGGMGDIVVKYPDRIVMLEATLMNASAQKRGEWEPVLRHAINLTVDSYPKKVFTLFVADELDYNTINIWRAVAAVTLASSVTGEKTEHVVIMPFTNEHFCNFIENNISDKKIINNIETSYNEIKANFDETWHDKILASL